MNKPLVSVIMPVYNGEKYIAKAIRSVLLQSYPNFELIIVDDASVDSTEKIVENFKDRRIKYVKLSINQGPAKARNIGLDIMEGEYVTFIDADDLWAPNRLEILLDTIRKVGSDFFVADDVVRFYEDNGKIRLYKSTLSNKRVVLKDNIAIITLEDYLKKEISQIQPLIRVADIKEDNIKFCENIRLDEDDIFYIDMFLTGKKLAICNYQTYFYRKNLSSLTRQTNLKKVGDELKKIIEICEEHINKSALNDKDIIINKLINKMKEKIIYGITCNYINDGNYIKAGKMIFKHPWIVSEIFNDVIMSRILFYLKFKLKDKLEIEDLNINGNRN